MRFFANRHIQPLLITYEALIKNTPAAITKIGNLVGVDVPEDKILKKPPSKKMADGYTEEILQNFRKDLREKEPQLLSPEEDMTIEELMVLAFQGPQERY